MRLRNWQRRGIGARVRCRNNWAGRAGLTRNRPPRLSVTAGRSSLVSDTAIMPVAVTVAPLVNVAGSVSV